jgi:predicted nicotinamide N-methyase
MRAEAAKVGPLREDHIALPRSERVLTIHRPEDTDALLDHAADDPEQNLPYWAEIWPSGMALADAILTEPEIVRGKRALELGAGIGVTAIAALSSRAKLLAVDYAPEALTLCRFNALANTGHDVETCQLNWRRPDDGFQARVGNGFPVVLAADVLYERRDVEPLLTLVDWLVAPDGMFWLAHPRRDPALRFIEAMATDGWVGSRDAHPGPWPDEKDTGVIVDIHRLRRMRKSR